LSLSHGRMGMAAFSCAIFVFVALAAPQGDAMSALALSGRARDRAGALWGQAALPFGGVGPCLRMRGGGFGSFSLRPALAEFGLDAREIAQLSELRDALGAGLDEVIRRNPDFSTDDRLVRFLRANQNDVQRTVKAWPVMLQWRAEMGCDAIRAQVLLAATYMNDP